MKVNHFWYNRESNSTGIVSFKPSKLRILTHIQRHQELILSELLDSIPPCHFTEWKVASKTEFKSVIETEITDNAQIIIIGRDSPLAEKVSRPVSIVTDVLVEVEPEFTVPENTTVFLSDSVGRHAVVIPEETTIRLREQWFDDELVTVSTKKSTSHALRNHLELTSFESLPSSDICWNQMLFSATYRFEILSFEGEIQRICYTDTEHRT